MDNLNKLRSSELSGRFDFLVSKHKVKFFIHLVRDSIDLQLLSTTFDNAFLCDCIRLKDAI